MTRTAEILLAEDEPAVREALVLLLKCEGYGVRAAADGEEALMSFRACRPDLLLLDVMMPKMNGYAVCREVRAVDAKIPVIFLTSLSDEMDELRGLKLGADDFVGKTEKTQILLARIAAALRRSRAAADAAVGEQHEQVFRIGDCKIDPANLQLVRPDGMQLELTMREVEFLRALSSKPTELLTRDYLLTRFWGMDFDGGDNALSVFICRLREKLGSSGELIQTVHRKGYRLSV